MEVIENADPESEMDRALDILEEGLCEWERNPDCRSLGGPALA